MTAPTREAVKHTPTPWSADDADGEGLFGIFDENGAGIAYLAEASQRGTALPYVETRGEITGTITRVTDWDVHAANATLIVRAVNAHDDLVKAADKVLAGLHARIDRAARDGAPHPVFDGIADLYAALVKAKAGGAS